MTHDHLRHKQKNRNNYKQIEKKNITKALMVLINKIFKMLLIKYIYSKLFNSKIFFVLIIKNYSKNSIMNRWNTRKLDLKRLKIFFNKRRRPLIMYFSLYCVLLPLQFKLLETFFIFSIKYSTIF